MFIHGFQLRQRTDLPLMVISQMPGLAAAAGRRGPG
jgi:hypothetical protein